MYFSKLIDKKLIIIPSSFKLFIRQKMPKTHFGFWAVGHLKAGQRLRLRQTLIELVVQTFKTMHKPVSFKSSGFGTEIR